MVDPEPATRGDASDAQHPADEDVGAIASLQRAVEPLVLPEVAAAAPAREHQESAVLLADVPSKAARDRRAIWHVTDPRG
jgi:hypothetical protein